MSLKLNAVQLRLKMLEDMLTFYFLILHSTVAVKVNMVKCNKKKYVHVISKYNTQIAVSRVQNVVCQKEHKKCEHVSLKLLFRNN